MKKLNLDIMMYLYYCWEIEKNPKYCSSIDSWKDFKKNTDRHLGDCTLAPAPCLRCMLQRVEIQGQNALDYIMGVG